MISTLLPLTNNEKKFCEYWLKYYSLMARYITSSYFGLHNLPKMIAYEANTRQRERVIKLLLGRYSKLKKQADLNRVIKYMEGGEDASFRKNYRIIPPQGGSEARWPSN